MVLGTSINPTNNKFSETTNLANHIKPLFDQPNIVILGATTPQEYYNSLRKDPAFATRIPRLDILDLPVSNTIRIVNSKKEVLEERY